MNSSKKFVFSFQKCQRISCIFHHGVDFRVIFFFKKSKFCTTEAVKTVPAIMFAEGGEGVGQSYVIATSFQLMSSQILAILKQEVAVSVLFYAKRSAFLLLVIISPSVKAQTSGSKSFS